jgi:hypothetical protein
MERSLRENITDGRTWLRGLIMVLFVIVWNVAELVLMLVALIQFGFRLFTGVANPRLESFGQGLGTYLYQIVLFLTFKSEDRPFPFAPWPDGPPINPRDLPVQTEQPPPPRPEDGG